jgi:hypothetical protein
MAKTSAILATAFAMIAAVTAGRSKGVYAENLANLVGKSGWNSAEFQDYSNSGPFFTPRIFIGISFFPS